MTRGAPVAVQNAPRAAGECTLRPGRHGAGRRPGPAPTAP